MKTITVLLRYNAELDDEYPIKVYKDCRTAHNTMIMLNKALLSKGFKDYFFTVDVEYVE